MTIVLVRKKKAVGLNKGRANFCTRLHNEPKSTFYIYLALAPKHDARVGEDIFCKEAEQKQNVCCILVR